MTLDEAIRHAEEVAEEKEKEGKLLCQSEGASMGCLTCAEEHMQLAEWLRDYKRLKEQEPICPSAGIDCEDCPAYEPSDDCISRQAVLKIIDGWYENNQDTENIEDLIILITYMASVKPQESQTEQFAKWVATEIFDDMWEYNKDAFPEIACRKLSKLGIVVRMGDEWMLVEPQESEE